MNGIRTNMHRATRISAHRDTLNPGGWLMQWNYTYRLSDKFGVSIVSSFRSIVIRPGMRGLWLDLPYYCYGGKHTYRRLPMGLTLRVLACCANGYLRDKARIVSDWASLLVSRAAYWAKSNLTPSGIADRLAARKERKAWDDLLGGRR